jgi:hypothetical protein
MVVVNTAGARVGQVTNVDLEHFEMDGGPGGRTSVGYDIIRWILGEEVVLYTCPDLETG